MFAAVWWWETRQALQISSQMGCVSLGMLATSTAGSVHWQITGHTELPRQPTVVGGGLCVAGWYRGLIAVSSSVGFLYI